MNRSRHFGILLSFVTLFCACDTKVKNVDSCGDGFLDPGEECDGANLPVGSCEELGYYGHTGPLACRADCTLNLDVCVGRCGDGTIQTIHGEDCEDGDLSGKSCLLLGLGSGDLACGPTCRFDASGCEIPAVCGDGAITAPVEQCEGTNLGESTCGTLGYYGGTLTCRPDCTFDLGSCQTFGRCGDGAIQAMYGESCEGADLGGVTCGDLGYYGGVLRCNGNCGFDTQDCVDEGRCGDGQVQAGHGEVCDGANLDGETCLTLGFHGGELTCVAGCGQLDVSSCVAEGRCGDEQLQAGYGEVCDGANLDDETCLTLGYHAGELSCAQDCLSLRMQECEASGFCGDGLLQDGFEQCDGVELGQATCRTQGRFTGSISCDDACGLVMTGCRSVTSLAAGDEHACVVLDDRTVRCWGSNTGSQLGDGTTHQRDYPVTVAGLTDVEQIAAGELHTCALKTNGTVWCWGSNGNGRLGDGSTTSRPAPVLVAGLPSAMHIAAGEAHTCAVLQNQSVWCWGANTYGQLGNGTTTHSSVPVQVAGSFFAVSVTAGASHSCALGTEGLVRCWGRNNYGQLGNGTITNSSVPVSSLSNASLLDAGDHHNCARRSDGAFFCWGYNADGQLGIGNITNRLNPTEVNGLPPVSFISAGAYHTCVAGSGQAYCWGRNSSGQLGSGTIVLRNPSPVLVQSGATFYDVAVGNVFSCGSQPGGVVACWGFSGSGELGQGSITPIPSPTQVPGLTGLSQLSAGRDFTCGIQADYNVTCWGAGGDGQLGNNSTRGSWIPATIAGLPNNVELVAGFGHACARGDDGIVLCWGDNGHGQVGDGFTTDRTVPTEVIPENVSSLAAGLLHTCAVDHIGEVSCWGRNSAGQVGDGTTTMRLEPVPVSGLSDVFRVTAGGAHSCALLTDGTVFCWGSNTNGQLGDGTLNNRLTPTHVSGLTQVVAISAGNTHTCALRTSGAISCWGSNTGGQLGDGTTVQRLTPVTVSGISTATAVLTANAHTCALLADGAVRCWGNNEWGQLGIGSVGSYRTSPQIVPGLTGVTGLGVGSLHTCALHTGGAVSCWGSNAFGALGQFYLEQSSLPVAVVP